MPIDPLYNNIFILDLFMQKLKNVNFWGFTYKNENFDFCLEWPKMKIFY